MTGGGPLTVVRAVAELRATLAGWRRAGDSIGLVPTMGALHAGHLALLRRAREECARAVATIFVNPRQFESADDLARYPRDEARDAALLAENGCDLLFAPDAAQMYPPGFATSVCVAGLGDALEGRHRPGHFSGVATVVCKLLTQAGADRAYFGEKDYQQLMVVRRMAADLDVATAIVPVATVREADGLALSSRNIHLTAEERALAPLLHRVLHDVARALEAGDAAAPLIEAGCARLAASGFSAIDYVALHAADDLAPLERAERPARLLAAAWLGRTRLIDNVAVRAAPV